MHWCTLGKRAGEGGGVGSALTVRQGCTCPGNAAERHIPPPPPPQNYSPLPPSFPPTPKSHTLVLAWADRKLGLLRASINHAQQCMTLLVRPTAAQVCFEGSFKVAKDPQDALCRASNTQCQACQGAAVCSTSSGQQHICSAITAKLYMAFNVMKLACYQTTSLVCSHFANV